LFTIVLKEVPTSGFPFYHYSGILQPRGATKTRSHKGNTIISSTVMDINLKYLTQLFCSIIIFFAPLRLGGKKVKMFAICLPEK